MKSGNDNFIDGGVFCNDPTFCAADYAKNGRKNMNNLHIISIGTGYRKPGKKRLELLKNATNQSEGFFKRQFLSIMRAANNFFFDLVAHGYAGVFEVIQNAFMNFDIVPRHIEAFLGTNFTRVNPELDSFYALDNVDSVDNLIMCADHDYDGRPIIDTHGRPIIDTQIDNACKLLLECVIKKKFYSCNHNNTPNEFNTWCTRMGFPVTAKDENCITVTAHYTKSASLKIANPKPAQTMKTCGTTILMLIPLVLAFAIVPWLLFPFLGGEWLEPNPELFQHYC